MSRTSNFTVAASADRNEDSESSASSASAAEPRDCDQAMLFTVDNGDFTIFKRETLCNIDLATLYGAPITFAEQVRPRYDVSVSHPDWVSGPQEGVPIADESFVVAHIETGVSQAVAMSRFNRTPRQVYEAALRRLHNNPREAYFHLAARIHPVLRSTDMEWGMTEPGTMAGLYAELKLGSTETYPGSSTSSALTSECGECGSNNVRVLHGRHWPFAVGTSARANVARMYRSIRGPCDERSCTTCRPHLREGTPNCSRPLQARIDWEYANSSGIVNGELVPARRRLNLDGQ